MQPDLALAVLSRGRPFARMAAAAAATTLAAAAAAMEAGGGGGASADLPCRSIARKRLSCCIDGDALVAAVPASVEGRKPTFSTIGRAPHTYAMAEASHGVVYIIHFMILQDYNIYGAARRNDCELD
jgi:hypothetical protein